MNTHQVYRLTAAIVLLASTVSCKNRQYNDQSESMANRAGNASAKPKFEVTAFRDTVHGAQYGQSLYVCLNTRSTESYKGKPWEPKAINLSELRAFMEKATSPAGGSKAPLFKGLMPIVQRIAKQAGENVPDMQTVYRFDVFELKDLPQQIGNMSTSDALHELAAATLPSGPSDSIGPSNSLPMSPRLPCP